MLIFNFWFSGFFPSKRGVRGVTPSCLLRGVTPTDASTREDLSIDVLITNVGLILTKLRWFQAFSCSSKVKIQILKFFEKKKKIGFPWCSIREDLFIDISITYVGLILTKLRWFLFSAFGNSGYGPYGQNSISSLSNFLKFFSHFWVSMV